MMVAGRRQVLDSLAVKANAGMDSLVGIQILDDSGAYADELNSEGETNDDKVDDDGDANKTVSSARNKAVQLHHQWKAKTYKEMPHSHKEGRAKFVSNHTHYSTTNPDARVSVKPGKPRQLNYTAQSVWNTDSCASVTSCYRLLFLL